MIVKKTYINDQADGFVEISPELASTWLKSNVQNRTLRRNFVNELKLKIQNGQWQPNTPDHIAFYTDGTLANGQHRLTAIAESGITVKAKVDFDIPKSAAICIDSGKKRSFSDNVQIVLDEKFYTSQISHAMRQVFEKGSRLSHEDHLAIAKTYKDRILSVSNLYKNMSKALKKTELIAASFSALSAGVSLNDLQEFAYVYATGHVPGSSKYNYDIALKYHDYVLMNQGLGRSKDLTPNVKLAEYIIDKFVTGKPGRIFKDNPTYVYPRLVI